MVAYAVVAAVVVLMVLVSGTPGFLKVVTASIAGVAGSILWLVLTYGAQPRE